MGSFIGALAGLLFGLGLIVSGMVQPAKVLGFLDLAGAWDPSLAFVMGVLPLVLSTGAGAEMRQAMGVAVFAGMIGVTLFGLFLTPLFYVTLRRLTGNAPLRHHGGQVAAAVDAPADAPAPAAPVIDALPQRGK